MPTLAYHQVVVGASSGIGMEVAKLLMRQGWTMGTQATYQAASQWKDFFFMEEGEGSDTPIAPNAQKCATPTIDLSNGKRVFSWSASARGLLFNRPSEQARRSAS